LTESVELTVPNTAEYLALVRYVATSMASRTHFNVDRVEDARLVADEAFTYLLPHVSSSIRCHFTMDDGILVMEMSAKTAAAALPDMNPFAAMILRALALDIHTEISHSTMRIALRMEHNTSLPT
jgi:hypothetical protein